MSEPTDIFEKDVGTWDVELTITPAPGAQPIVQKGVSQNRRVGGGRWLVTDLRVDSGFEGHGVYGWDAALGKYVGVWVDSMLGSIARSTGTWDAAARTMTLVTEATSQGRVVRYREITQLRDDGTQLYSNLMPLPDGGEFEMLRAIHRRRG
jgi:hypothetical protein